MEIPADFLANITELGLNEVTYNVEKSKFITAARSIIMKTRKLKYLRISPYGQPNSWISLIAECAPVLSNLETLIIGAQTIIEEDLKQIRPLPGQDDNNKDINSIRRVPIDMSAAAILADEMPDSEIPFSRKTALN